MDRGEAAHPVNVVQFPGQHRATVSPPADPTDAFAAFVQAQLAYENDPSSETRAGRQAAYLRFHASFTGAA